MKKVLFVFSLIYSTSIFAAPRKDPFSEYTKQGYGSAGCGLGAMVMGPKGNQILAATTNNVFSANQTFGLSSGTSNCQQEAMFKSSWEIQNFIEVNKWALANDAARGQGDALSNLAILMNCDSSLMGDAMKKNYKKIFTEAKMQSDIIHENINQIVAKPDICDPI